MKLQRGFVPAVILESILALLACSCGHGGESAPVAPVVGALTPDSGTGRVQAFKLSVTHSGGAAQVYDVQVMFADSVQDAKNACWIEFNNLNRIVAARNEEGTEWLAGVEVGSPDTVANTNCSVAARDVKVENKGNESNVTFTVSFAPVFKGPKNVMVIASAPHAHSGWQGRGTWTVN
jgi:hypothetical protein